MHSKPHYYPLYDVTSSECMSARKIAMPSGRRRCCTWPMHRRVSWPKMACPCISVPLHRGRPAMFTSVMAVSALKSWCILDPNVRGRLPSPTGHPSWRTTALGLNRLHCPSVWVRRLSDVIMDDSFLIVCLLNVRVLGMQSSSSDSVIKILSSREY